ncbi:LIM domain-containing protein PLIM2c-like isoform X2 [Hibiscus syriacus]|uniref:LIM domain-containing protein PLIM2c-like isoform X2 n=1 Tax=Hibiscus syriacus TaxID=106335 RepID=UPI001923FB08|nr:LIM domain-containing protein PLIM2c-like isoform X2 [Hibiscus syriacus]
MAFSGTTEKCRSCDKTVHFYDMTSADGVPYHKTCFRCSKCNGLLVVSTYCARDGVLYCKPHFEQVCKATGTYTSKEPKPNGLQRAPSKVAAMFSGTQEKCGVCKKTCYPLEKVTVEGEIYHKNCFRCAHGGCFLTTSSYAALDGFLYCKHHFSQLFKETGSYSHLTKTTSMKKPSAGEADSESKGDDNEVTSTETEAQTAEEHDQ